MGLIASVVGATGLVGRDVVSLLCGDADVDAVHLFVRRALPESQLTSNPKLTQHVIDFDRLEDISWPRCDVLFCCLGTTIKAAGSRDAFRTVDFDYVVGSARRARQAGASSLIVVSALGADAKSTVFYNRTKGEMEAAVAILGFEHVAIVRPSLLDGARTELRIGERLALAASKLINPLLPARYRPVPVRSVARAMRAVTKNNAPGITILESEQIARFT
jgi:uncharacterized protein YbjT (DUF2867 family)